MPSNQRQLIEQAKFAYSPLGKAFEKQIEKQVDVIKCLDISNKKDELKQIEGIFPQNLINDLILAKLKEIVKFQDIIKKDYKMLKQNNFAIELQNFEKGTKALQKKSFLNNLGLLFSERKSY